MKRWVSDLKKLSSALSGQANRRSKSKPKTTCAVWAAQIIDGLSPHTRLTKGDNSKFYRIASLLWEAATGERDGDMKRACDAYIDWKAQRFSPNR